MIEALKVRHASRAAARLREATLALVLFELGCRMSNVERITPGVSALRQLRTDHGLKRASGRVPDCPSFFLRRRVMYAMAASCAVASFEQYWRVAGQEPGWALAYAFRDYRARFGEWFDSNDDGDGRPRPIDFNIDHLFLLVGQTFKLWGEPLSLRLFECPTCGGRFLSDYLPPSSRAPIVDKCHFCDLAGRYNWDRRVARPLELICSQANHPMPVEELLDALQARTESPSPSVDLDAAGSRQPTLVLQA